MKDYSNGNSQLPSMLKSLFDKLQDILCCHVLPSNRKRLDTMIERKIMEIRRRSPPDHLNFKTMDAIIMKFPQFREGFKEIGDIFEHYDADSNGAIDIEELKKCFRAIEFNVEEAEIKDLYHYCHMDRNKGIRFNEFIVILCLTYLLMDSSTSSRAHEALNTNWPMIETTFDAIVQVFLFLDKRGDGKLKRKDFVRALNEVSPKEKSPSHVTWSRFKEMDWDRNGRVSFKEFVYSFIGWVGMDDDHESPKHQV